MAVVPQPRRSSYRIVCVGATGRNMENGLEPEQQGNVEVDLKKEAAELPNVREIEEKVIEVLRTIYDPEIPVNIYELGLIYNLDVAPLGIVNIRMTLTSPMCPVAESLPPDVESKVRTVPGVRDVSLEVVWDPPWSMDKMTEAAKLQLGLL